MTMFRNFCYKPILLCLEDRVLDKYYKAAFPCMRFIYPTEFVRTTFVGVTKSDQTLFNVGVSICTDFSTEK